MIDFVLINVTGTVVATTVVTGLSVIIVVPSIEEVCLIEVVLLNLSLLLQVLFYSPDRSIGKFSLICTTLTELTYILYFKSSFLLSRYRLCHSI